MATQQILVLVEHPDVRLLIQTVLRGCGCTPLVVSSGQQALRAIKSEHPIGMILDIDLMHESASALSRQIKAHSSIPLVLLTNDIHSAYDISELLTYASELLAKPFELDDFVRIINRCLLRRGPQLSPHPVQAERRTSLQAVSR